jgi:hypothetical protein
VAWLGGSRGKSWPRSTPIMLLAAVGVVLGWQRVLLVAPLAAALVAVLVIGTRVARGQGSVPLAGIVAALAAWIAVEWAGVLMPAVLQVTSDPVTGCAVSAQATAAAAILAGALVPADYHAVPAAPPPAPVAAAELNPLSSVEPPPP